MYFIFPKKLQPQKHKKNMRKIVEKQIKTPREFRNELNNIKRKGKIEGGEITNLTNEINLYSHHYKLDQSLKRQIDFPKMRIISLTNPLILKEKKLENLKKLQQSAIIIANIMSKYS